MGLLTPTITQSWHFCHPQCRHTKAVRDHEHMLAGHLSCWLVSLCQGNPAISPRKGTFPYAPRTVELPVTT